MKKIKLIVTKYGGPIFSVYSDDFAMWSRHSGSKTSVRRETHLEFDNESQLWKGWDADTGELVCKAETRSECLAMEQEWVEKKLRKRAYEEAIKAKRRLDAEFEGIERGATSVSG